MPRQTNRTENQPFLNKYTDNDQEAEPSPSLPHYYQNSLIQRNTIISHTLVFLVTSSLWLLIIYLLTNTIPNPNTTSTPSSYRHNITSNATLQTCGSTANEAREKNCQYDILLNNWVPAPCYDDEFVLEYTDDESWGAYADANMTIKLTPLEMSEAEYYYTSVRDHINHCAVLWKKQFFSLYEERRAIDTIVANPGHTDHCAQYLMDVEESKVNEATRVERGFAGCWIRD